MYKNFPNEQEKKEKYDHAHSTIKCNFSDYFLIE